MKYLLLFFLTLFPFNLIVYAMENEDDQECSIEFNLNSAVHFQKKDSLDECFKKLGKNELQAVTIIGSASPGGTVKLNTKLANERASTIKKLVKLKYPNARIKVITFKENKEIGKKTQLYFISKSNEDKQKLTTAQEQINLLQRKNDVLMAENENNKDKLSHAQYKSEVEKNKVTEDNEYFYPNGYKLNSALRLGLDTTRGNEVLHFSSIGAEASWLNHEKYLRPEFGIKGSTSLKDVHVVNNDDVTQVSNVYGFVGGGVSVMGFVTGLRLLAGHEWININSHVPEHNQFALGGEGRIGYEWQKGMALFASYALTDHLQMVGLDFGYNFL